jgi:hypothetical protein
MPANYNNAFKSKNMGSKRITFNPKKNDVSDIKEQKDAGKAKTGHLKYYLESFLKVNQKIYSSYLYIEVITLIFFFDYFQEPSTSNSGYAQGNKMSSKTNKIDSEDDDLTSIENTQEDSDEDFLLCNQENEKNYLNIKEVSKLSLFS